MRALPIVLFVAAAACRREPSSTPEPEPTPAPEAAPVDTTDEAPPEAPVATTIDRPPATIFRIELDRVLARGPGWLLGQLAPEPYREDGRFVGWRIGAVFPDAPELCTALGCDLREGDVIVSVQGDRLQTPQALTAMIERIDGFDALTVDRIRDGERRKVVYRIAD